MMIETEAVRAVMKMTAEGKRARGRPKKDGWMRLGMILELLKCVCKGCGRSRQVKPGGLGQ